MPIYDYQCTKCNSIAEKIVSNDKAKPTCDCGGKMKKLDIPTKFGWTWGKGPHWTSQ